jgi:hypothetical protein
MSRRAADRLRQDLSLKERPNALDSSSPWLRVEAGAERESESARAPSLGGIGTAAAPGCPYALFFAAG